MKIKPSAENSHQLDSRLQTQAILSRGGRHAALRTWAGRLAHETRNPLAAIRAACGSLREELEDPEQLETLDLTIKEIDRVLGYISATVQNTTVQIEKPEEIYLNDELTEVAALVEESSPTEISVSCEINDSATCILPRNAFRIAMHSLLEFLINNFRAASIRIDTETMQKRMLLHFSANRSDRGPFAFEVESLSGRSADLNTIGYSIADRFARDVRGRLRHDETPNGSLLITLDLPWTTDA